jgi:hypothetical protein
MCEIAHVSLPRGVLFLLVCVLPSSLYAAGVRAKIPTIGFTFRGPDGKTATISLRPTKSRAFLTISAPAAERPFQPHNRFVVRGKPTRTRRLAGNASFFAYGDLLYPARGELWIPPQARELVFSAWASGAVPIAVEMSNRSFRLSTGWQDERTANRLVVMSATLERASRSRVWDSSLDVSVHQKGCDLVVVAGRLLASDLFSRDERVALRAARRRSPQGPWEAEGDHRHVNVSYG